MNPGDESEETLETLASEAGMSAEEFERLGAEPAPDVLSGVQSKLHQRSGGRFYRDRFSRMQSTTITIWITTLLIVGACALWLLFR